MSESPKSILSLVTVDGAWWLFLREYVFLGEGAGTFLGTITGELTIVEAFVTVKKHSILLEGAIMYLIDSKDKAAWCFIVKP